MADVLTSSYGNFGMRFNSNEPRIPYNNSSSADDGSVASYPWEHMYAALGQANDGLAAIGRGVKIMDGSDDVTDEYQAIGTFIQGAALSAVGLNFDKGFIIDENTPIPVPLTFYTYKEVADAAVAKFDLAIGFATGKSWEISKTYFTDIGMTADKFAMLANTMAARTLAYTPRDAAENDAVDWARVAAYARKGINYDFAPIGDYNNWWDDYVFYTDAPSWMRVDMRVIHELDPSQPDHWPADNCSAPIGEATSADARLTTDFTYYPQIPFNPARGCYHFSHYGHTRLLNYGRDGNAFQIGPAPMIRKAENDLLLAEADVRTGTNLAEAADLINITRVGRGHLPPVSAATGAAGLLKAIQYEQDIELLGAGSGTQFYDRRRIDGLQAQTPLHLPVPASELETDGLPVYTFGGPNDPDR
jgi:hypothetical protein